MPEDDMQLKQSSGFEEKCLKWELKPSVTDLPSACTPDSHFHHICVQLGTMHIGVNLEHDKHIFRLYFKRLYFHSVCEKLIGIIMYYHLQRQL